MVYDLTWYCFYIIIFIEELLNHSLSGLTNIRFLHCSDVQSSGL